MKEIKKDLLTVDVVFATDTAVFVSDAAFRKIILSPSLVHFDPGMEASYVETTVFEKILKAQVENGTDFYDELGSAGYSNVRRQ
ncbi:hypothetical protein Tbd_0942 [Thiobacillus denitrificans ATCC 25259]|uniref:Uncharacterized protein n=1 Tax=Thiobacillus denitrificans (strain ATCC 25259 / T1) TaxID=292415 RepID=Q3SK95_THIDA|nr:hypothetical protein [Thiobacillus denitrificans]AAZ96895.1 hypothetical protein Tbd_0942 [Thiobacillus denitrificans ATCC 25259]